MSQLQRALFLGLLGCVSLLTVPKPATAIPAPASLRTSPCAIFAAAHTPCVAAFSTIRVVYPAYSHPLYQVTRQSDKTAINIGVLPDGFADAAMQDKFCAKTTCTITKIYDQSHNHNDLTVAPPGGAAKGRGPGGHDLPAIADALPITAGGHKVYGVYISAGMGYRIDATRGIAANGKPEGVYMVTSGIHVNGGCCFDFGNAEKNNNDNGKGHMDAISFMCNGHCPAQVGLDMEDGIYPPFQAPGGIPFVTAMGASSGQKTYAVYWGNAQSGKLTTTGSIPLPAQAYSPMKQEGAIILGIGGDNSNGSIGSFFEGVMTTGAPTSAAMNAVQANIVSVGYAIPAVR